MSPYKSSRVRSILASVALAAVFAVGPATPILTQPLAHDQAQPIKKVKRGFQFTRLYGSSPYVCTPSGFGQRARCYLRSV